MVGTSSRTLKSSRAKHGPAQPFSTRIGFFFYQTVGLNPPSDFEECRN